MIQRLLSIRLGGRAGSISIPSNKGMNIVSIYVSVHMNNITDIITIGPGIEFSGFYSRLDSKLLYTCHLNEIDGWETSERTIRVSGEIDIELHRLISRETYNLCLELPYYSGSDLIELITSGDV